MTTSDGNRVRQGGSTLNKGDRDTHMCRDTHTHLPCEGVRRRRGSWAVAGWGSHTAPRCPWGPRTPCHILKERCHCWSTWEGGSEGEREGRGRQHPRWPLRKDTTCQTKTDEQKALQYSKSLHLIWTIFRSHLKMQTNTPLEVKFTNYQTNQTTWDTHELCYSYIKKL